MKSNPECDLLKRKVEKENRSQKHIINCYMFYIHDVEEEASKGPNVSITTFNLFNDL